MRPREVYIQPIIATNRRPANCPLPRWPSMERAHCLGPSLLFPASLTVPSPMACFPSSRVLARCMHSSRACQHLLEHAQLATAHQPSNYTLSLHANGDMGCTLLPARPTQLLEIMPQTSRSAAFPLQPSSQPRHSSVATANQLLPLLTRVASAPRTNPITPHLLLVQATPMPLALRALFLFSRCTQKLAHLQRSCTKSIEAGPRIPAENWAKSRQQTRPADQLQLCPCETSHSTFHAATVASHQAPYALALYHQPFSCLEPLQAAHQPSH